MQPVPSPCRQICRLDDSGELCVGCFRTLCEIATWSGMTPEEQVATLAVCEARRRLAGPFDPASADGPPVALHDPNCCHDEPTAAEA